MKAKNFKYWITQDLHEQFGIERIYDSSLLNEWLSAQNSIAEAEATRLEELRQNLLLNVDNWNEEELKMMFIGQILELVAIKGKNFRTFYDRSINITVNSISLSGTLDMVVATGFQIPRKPFFCVHEYKQELKRDNDPKGQLLVEMIALQAINLPDETLFMVVMC